ncbi:glycosyltransferase family 4 protein [Funiculus sociatus GB2-A5]|uniref:Glycosyltransferase family 4 protein n=1 Tax=Funiculus sociatus GB2-A5 TaxID=2933946 RepID=A0ABV0JVQ1_9CYAN|nr:MULTISPECIES: glycosyltransferase family 4 protein [unclassified Trichocoleus]MBD1907418.1 glycosyltransferase family 4 protein [Trichocoleus sp. FACHB-832]MBD2063195.1 glycosyltransferase family 4 protein [Trichocoleus sp. FACHB-6]
MKILLTIHHDLNPNAGASGATWKLGQEYQKLGHEVEYYTFDRLPDKLPGLVKSIIFPGFVASQISALVKKQAVDVVDASTGDAWIWAKMRRSSRENSPLLVTRSHGLEHSMHLENLEEARRGNLDLSWKYSLYHGGFRLWEVATSLRYADLVLLLNHRDAEYVVEKLGVNSEQMHIVANGIPEEFLNLPFEPMPEAEDSTIYIAQVGNYIARKGIKYGAAALNAILARYPQLKISFLGTGCSEAEVHADFEPAIRDRIQVIPHYSHEALPNLLRGHHIKLFPTLSEGFSLALTETMACGLAPVTTTTPGAMEIVKNGYNGILVPARHSQAIEQALERLVLDRPYLQQLRRNAYATAQRYSWERIARDNLAFYEETLSQREGLSERYLSKV